MKRNSKKQPSLDDLINEQLRLSEEQLRISKIARLAAENQSKIIDEYCKRVEDEMFKRPQRPGVIIVDRRLLSENLTKSQLN